MASDLRGSNPDGARVEELAAIAENESISTNYDPGNVRFDQACVESLVFLYKADFGPYYLEKKKFTFIKLSREFQPETHQTPIIA